MREGIHPKYNFVIMKDASSDFAFLTRSTKSSGQKMKWEDGNEYPVLTMEISSASHPFFTGKQKLMDTAGRIEKFKRKYEKNTTTAETPKK
jgi:large subunit ribosomal protein L31